MKRPFTLAGAFGLGLAAMYFFDPIHGRRRRAVTRDKIHSSLHKASCLAHKTREDFHNRTRGLLASLDGRLHRANATDDVLEARIHSKLGRVVSHPHAIVVHVLDGCAALRGPVLAHELARLISAVGAVPGVRSVNNLLDVHKHPGHIPALQGHRIPARTKFVLAKDNWPLSVRCLATLTGAALASYGLLRKKTSAKLLALAGSGLCLRGLTNLGAARLTGIGAGPRAVDLRKTITLQAPLDEVFNFWLNFENLPQFMGHVRDIKNLGERRSHWTVRGPAGAAIRWTARITQFIPYELIAWRTEPGSAVEHAGLVRFAPTPSGGTRLDIFMSYNPVAGAIGHLIAVLLGSDPKRAMDDDLVRFKSLLEQGKATVAHHTITRADLAQPSFTSSEPEGNPT